MAQTSASDMASTSRPAGRHPTHSNAEDAPPQQVQPTAASPPSSASVQTSTHLTPGSSDEESEDDLAIDENELLAGGDGGGGESYELQDMGGGKGGRHRGAYSDDQEDGRARRRKRRTSASTMASFQLYTPDEERAVVKKFDRRLVVFVAFLYMLSFLDRSNIGNARVAGMDDDLQSTPPREDWYEWALTAFYIAYIAFEWMSLLWRLIPAHIYVAMIVLSWGVIAALQAVAVSYPMLIFLRTLLGVGEAAFTGIPFYLSFFFKRSELAFRTAIFISAAPLATSFASSLAWVIVKLGESGPIAPWRLLFLIEGFPSVIVATIAWHVIPDRPETASYLTPREQKVALLRLRHEKPRQRRGKAAAENSSGGGSTLSVLWDPVAWLTAVIFFLTNMAYSSLPVFLPTILTAMGHSALSAQALAAPPYLAAFVVVLATARGSDLMRARAPLLIAHALASAAGYGLLALGRPVFGLEPGSMWRYLAVYPAAVGFFNVVVLTLAWAVNNQRGEGRQGGGFALLQLVGQCGPLVGTRLYPDRDAPYYESGMSVCAAAMLAVAVLALLLRWLLVRRNRRLDADEDVGGGGDGDGEEEEGLVGSSSGVEKEAPGERFRYML